MKFYFGRSYLKIYLKDYPHDREDHPDVGELAKSYFTKVGMQDASLEVTREPVRFTIVSPGQTILPDGEPETLVAAE